MSKSQERENEEEEEDEKEDNTVRVRDMTWMNSTTQSTRQSFTSWCVYVFFSSFDYYFADSLLCRMDFHARG